MGFDGKSRPNDLWKRFRNPMNESLIGYERRILALKVQLGYNVASSKNDTSEREELLGNFNEIFVSHS